MRLKERKTAGRGHVHMCEHVRPIADRRGHMYSRKRIAFFSGNSGRGEQPAACGAVFFDFLLKPGDGYAELSGEACEAQALCRVTSDQLPGQPDFVIRESFSALKALHGYPRFTIFMRYTSQVCGAREEDRVALTERSLRPV